MGFLDCCCRRKDDDFAKGKAAYEQYSRSKRSEDLQTALHLFDSAATKYRDLPPNEKKLDHLSVILTTYASALFEKYSRYGQSPSDLAVVNDLEEEALQLFENMTNADEIAPEYEKLLLNLGNSYINRYQNLSQDQRQGTILFNKAIQKYNALRLNPKASLELRRSCIIKMAEALNAWSEGQQSATPEERKLRVDEAIEMLRKAKVDLGRGTSKESQTFIGQCLFNLAISYGIRYWIEKDSGSLDNAIPDLDEAIEFNQQAREMLLEGQGVELLYCLFDLSQQLFWKYEYFAEIAEDETSIAQDGLEALQNSERFVREGLNVVDGQEKKTEEIKNIREDLQKVLDAIEQQTLAPAP